jgi:hypothetical protein
MVKMFLALLEIIFGWSLDIFLVWIAYGVSRMICSLISINGNEAIALSSLAAIYVIVKLVAISLKPKE